MTLKKIKGIQGGIHGPLKAYNKNYVTLWKKVFPSYKSKATQQRNAAQDAIELLKTRMEDLAFYNAKKTKFVKCLNNFYA